MSTIRKYRPIFEPKKQKKSLFSVDRCLLAGFVGMTGIGLAQPSIMSFAFNDTVPAATMTASIKGPILAAKPSPDYTPVGSIERKPAEPPANPHGLRLGR